MFLCMYFVFYLLLPVSVLQVLEWLDSHGSVFLNKNTAIGKSLQKAKALQKNFEHFEMVAQVLHGFVFYNQFLAQVLHGFVLYNQFPLAFFAFRYF